MTEQVSVLIKYQTCDLARDWAAAISAYDSAEATAWVVPFTQAQQAYWATQAYWNEGVWTEPFNGYAADYATQRTNAITNTAQSAYENCMTGGASSLPAPLEPSFRLVVQTQLDGGNLSGGRTFAPAGLSAQLNIAFAPAQVLPPLDWRAFYRLGTVHIDFNFIENWFMSFPSSGGYTQPVYTTLPMRPSIQVEANNLVSIAADFIPYIDVPDGRFIEVPADLTADFTAIQSSFAFTVYRWVYLPDGQVIETHVDWLDQMNGTLSDRNATVEFPELGATCDESGVVDVYHFITAYSFGTLYQLSDPVQKVRTQYGVYDFEVPAETFGTTPPSYGPPGYLSLHESFLYQAELKLGIVRVKYYQDGVFQYQREFLVWNGAPFMPSSLIGMTSTASYEKSMTASTSLTVQITLSGGTTLNGVYDVPVVEDVVVSNINSGTLSVGTSSHVIDDGAILKVEGVLKPLATYTPYGAFVVDQPTYQASGNFLSMLPDFIDHVYFNLDIDYAWDYKTSAFYRVVFKLDNTQPVGMGVVLNFAGYKAWVVVPPNTTKYYACLVPSGISSFTVQMTKVSPETSPVGFAEEEISSTAFIKVLSASGQYAYPETLGFSPLSKSVSKVSGGTSGFPSIAAPINSYYVATPWSSTSLVIAFDYTRYMTAGNSANIQSSINAGYSVVAYSTRSTGALMGKPDTWYARVTVSSAQIAQLKAFLGITENILLINISDIRSVVGTGSAWSASFSLPNGSIVGDSEMRAAYVSVVVGPLLAANPEAGSAAFYEGTYYGPNHSNARVDPSVRCGTYLAPSHFKAYNLQEVGSMTLPTSGLIKYNL